MRAGRPSRSRAPIHPSEQADRRPRDATGSPCGVRGRLRPAPENLRRSTDRRRSLAEQRRTLTIPPGHGVAGIEHREHVAGPLSEVESLLRLGGVSIHDGGMPASGLIKVRVSGSRRPLPRNWSQAPASKPVTSPASRSMIALAVNQSSSPKRPHQSAV
jgi:hypothetical protein